MQLMEPAKGRLKVRGFRHCNSLRRQANLVFYVAVSGRQRGPPRRTCRRRLAAAAGLFRVRAVGSFVSDLSAVEASCEETSLSRKSGPQA